MAKSTFYLKPSADISVGHTLTPAESTAAYLLINEEVNDSTSTYIGASGDGILASSFRMALSGDIGINKIASAFFRIYVSLDNGGGDGGNSKALFTIKDKNDNEIWHCTAGYSGYNARSDLYSDEIGYYDLSGNDGATGEFEFSDLATALNNRIVENGTNDLSELTLTIETTLAHSDSGKNDPTAVISQAIFVLECGEDFNIHTKVNGSWMQAQTAYQKQSGVWVEITEDECREILQNLLVTKG